MCHTIIDITIVSFPFVFSCYYHRMIGLALTNEQLATLLKMVYVANTVANGPFGDRVSRKDFDDMEQYVFSRAKDVFPMAVYQHKADEGDEHHHPSVIFESDPDVNALFDQYEEYVARMVMAEKLAERDVEREFGVHAKDQMNAAQFEELVAERSTEYEELLEEHGLKVLEIAPQFKK